MTRCMGVVFGTSGRWPTRSGRAGALFDTCQGCGKSVCVRTYVVARRMPLSVGKGGGIFED